MKKMVYALLVITFGLTACDKDDELKELPVTTTMTRSIDFTRTGIQKDTAYTPADKMITGAGFSNFSFETEKNMFYVFFNAGPHMDNAVGDNIQFQVERTKLKEGYVGTYSLNATTDPLKYISYIYTIRDARGGITSSGNDSGMGLDMQGELKIDSYDAARKTISGSYRMSAKLTDDPTTFNTGYDPNHQCDLTVTGTFSNVKIKQD